MGRSFVHILALIPMALAVGAMSASAASILIDFESDFPTSAGFPTGCIASVDLFCSITGNSFTSEDSSQIHFGETPTQPPGQEQMALLATSFTSNTDVDNLQALAVGVQGDSGWLQIAFDVPADSIRMDLLFGTVGAGDMAVLTAFDDAGEVVGTNSVNLGQGEISFDCVLFDCGTFDRFDRVEIAFVGSIPDGMTEVVDNVSVTLIPEPGAAVAFGVGALLVGAACARRGRT